MIFDKLRSVRRLNGPDPEVLRAVEASGLFDPAWYVQRYPDVEGFPKGPLAHFCRYGLEERRYPSPHVSLAKYLARNPKARTGPVSAILTALAGLTLRERAKACLPDDDTSLAYLTRQGDLFDEAWYLDRNPDVTQSGLEPLDHFVRHGMYELRDPGPAFDGEFYRDRHPDYEDLSRTPFEHFVRLGRQLGHAGTGSRRSNGPDPEILRAVEASGLFDPAWYLYRYPDVEGFPKGPLAHFCRYGLEERRYPSPHVSLAKYLARNPKARTGPVSAILTALAGLNPRERADACLPDDDASLAYLTRQGDLFDEAWYLDRNPDVTQSGLEPLDHFVRHGMYELRDPGPAFDGEFYRDRHPDYEDLSRTPFEHFVRLGRRSGYVGAGSPRYERWLSAYDVLTRDDLDRIRVDGATVSRPTAVCHVFDVAACNRFDLIVARWSEQTVAGCDVRLIRGAGVTDGLWEACAAHVRDRSAMSVTEASVALDGLPDDAVVLLCHGPSLVRPHTAYVLSQVMAHHGAEAAYADHDHVDGAGRRTGPVFKPAMSPEFMRNLPYAGSVVAVRLRDRSRDRLTAAIASAAAGDAERAWASLLLDLPRGKVARSPFLLYHRPVGTGPATVHEPVPGPRFARSGLQPAIDAPRRVAPKPASGGPALGHREGSGWVDLRAPIDPEARSPSVTIVIPTRDRGELLRECIDSLTSETDYPAGCRQIVVVDNGSEEEATLAYFAELEARADVTVVPSPGPFNFSKVCNDGAARADGEVLVFLNNDVTVNRRNWLRLLVTHAVEPDVGAVGARLLYPDGSVQHGGVVLGVKGVGAHRLHGASAASADEVDVTREMLAVTGACLAIRRALFQALGGFDPVLQVAFNDVKLCADAFEAGYRGVYVAEPLLVHHESKSRGFDDTALKQRRNAREAIYVRERHASLFRDDPSYSPNLSLTRIGDLATPRVVRPWRRSAAGRRRVLLLSRVLNQGSGVAVVVRQQAMFLRARGWEVTVGGPIGPRDLAFEGCRRVDVRTPETAAAHAVEHGLDCVIAHTPPFFSITRHLGAQPLAFFMDHGEPTPHLFPDRDHREGVDWEKRFCAPLARRVFVISRTVFRHQHRDDAIVIRNGNAHMAAWSPAWAGRRRALRAKLGLEGCFTVLNVCRFGPGERLYKGVGRYGEVASDLPYRHPHLAGRVRFVLAGRGDEDDVATARAMGLTVFANPSDAEMAELYAASDLYLNLSEWEGYNLGIGQALAMGLDVVASDIEAHREFDVELLTGIPEICAAVARRHAEWDEDAKGREPMVEGWDGPLTRLAETIERDVDAVVPQWS